ncbi:hypothetical protein EF888_07295 [Silicimonas algicola]|uniref:Putative DNA primase/helicase n=1 Tax=Silicimonas algicola TaxID=1826607 RepID=A0A316G5E3_9RHOB|nr:phage/plasmid primase, P4 family [Silicimonas algicola]AZQ66957.1 hypothetical protein EF888_07295 [Silicimonas algicola]PWK55535.1 putative DNA primase/helicase [Silicimonas algicola]
MTIADLDMTPGDVDLSEDGVARAFAEMQAGYRLYDNDAGKWFVYVGDCWQLDHTQSTTFAARELVNTVSFKINSNKRTRYRSSSFVSGVERLARSDPALSVRQENFDTDLWLLGCPGVTVDLRTGKPREPDPRDMITRLTSVAPAETAHCPRWDDFLSEATGGDDDMKGFLQRFLGYSLTGFTTEHALIFAWGGGGNGKSVFQNTAANIMGDHATHAAMETFISSRQDRHSTELAYLRGARLVTASETDEGRAWAEARIKTLTGGDPVTARFMHKDPFTFIPQFKLLIVGNHQPALQSVDDAARRRFNIVPFTRRPEKPDPDLEAKLRKEHPQILRWMIDGCLDWQANGLKRPQSVLDATAEYFSEQDFVGQWLGEVAILEPGNPHRFTSSADLFASWKAYAEKAGEMVGAQKGLAGKLRRFGLTTEMRSIGGQKLRGWVGVSLKVRASGHD